MVNSESTVVRALLVVALVVAATGCFGPRVTWREVDVGDVPLGDAWRAIEEMSAVDGYPTDPASTDRGLREFTSKWRSVELPFRRANRRRVHARFEKTDAGGWMVRYYVQLQKVDDIAKTFDPADDDWEEAGQDAETENRFAAKLRLRFSGATEGSDPR